MVPESVAIICLAILALAKYSEAACEFPDVNIMPNVTVPEDYRVGNIIATFIIKDNTTDGPESIVGLRVNFTSEIPAVYNNWNNAMYFTIEYLIKSEAYVHLHAGAGFAEFAEWQRIREFSPRFTVTCPGELGIVQLPPTWTITLEAVNNHSPVFISAPTLINVELDKWNSDSVITTSSIVVRNNDYQESHSHMQIETESELPLFVKTGRTTGYGAPTLHFDLRLLNDKVTGLHSVKLTAVDTNDPSLTGEVNFLVNVIPRSGAMHQVGTVLMVIFFFIASTLIPKY